MKLSRILYYTNLLGFKHFFSALEKLLYTPTNFHYKHEKRNMVPSSLTFPLILFSSKSIWCILQQLLHVFNFQISHIRLWELFQMDQMTSTHERISSTRKRNRKMNKLRKSLKKHQLFSAIFHPPLLKRNILLASSNNFFACFEWKICTESMIRRNTLLKYC